MYTYEEWNEIIRKYKNDEINIGVQLPLARQFIMSCSSKHVLWVAIIMFIIPCITLICAFLTYHFWGILFLIGFIITFMGVWGMASYNFSVTSSFLLGFGIFTIVLLFISSFNFILPLLLSLLDFILIFSFFTSVGKHIINDFAFNDYSTFCYLIENKVILIRSKKTS